MKQIIPTTQYKKDLKRYANQRKKMEALLEILRCLANGSYGCKHSLIYFSISKAVI